MSVSYWRHPARSGGRRGMQSGPGGSGRGALNVGPRDGRVRVCIGEHGVQTGREWVLIGVRGAAGGGFRAGSAELPGLGLTGERGAARGGL